MIFDSCSPFSFLFFDCRYHIDCIEALGRTSPAVGESEAEHGTTEAVNNRDLLQYEATSAQ